LDPETIEKYLLNEQNEYFFKNSNIENFLFKDSSLSQKELDVE